MKNNSFILTAETKIGTFGETLYRIKATRDVHPLCIDWSGEFVSRTLHCKKGALGGWVSKDVTIGENGWVSCNAEVSGGATISGLVEDNAIVHGKSEIHGTVRDDAKVIGDFYICHHSYIKHEAYLHGAGLINADGDYEGGLEIGGRAEIIGYVEITDNFSTGFKYIKGKDFPKVKIVGNFLSSGKTEIGGECTFIGNISVSENEFYNTSIKCDIEIPRDIKIFGDRILGRLGDLYGFDVEYSISNRVFTTESRKIKKNMDNVTNVSSREILYLADEYYKDSPKSRGHIDFKEFVDFCVRFSIYHDDHQF